MSRPDPCSAVASVRLDSAASPARGGARQGKAGRAGLAPDSDERPTWGRTLVKGAGMGPAARAAGDQRFWDRNLITSS